MKTLILFFLFTTLAEAKRMAPPVVPAVIEDGVSYTTGIKNSSCDSTTRDNCGFLGFVKATDQTTQKVKWTTILYSKLYDLNLELDIQDIHPHYLKIDKKKQLIIRDENGSEYVVDAKTGKLLKPLKSIIYATPKAI